MSDMNYFAKTENELMEFLGGPQVAGIDAHMAAAKTALMRKVIDRAIKAFERNEEVIDSAIGKLNDNERRISEIMKENNQLGINMKYATWTIAAAAVINLFICLIALFK